ncbi:MAG TPA: hypothetical protein VGC65_05805 [Bacteroidia bacterium]|jgi:hypothetical protein
MKSFFILVLLCFFLLPCKGQTTIAQSGENTGISFTFPWLNYYRYVDYHKHASNRKFGFFGIGFSAYYKKNEHKFAFSCSTTEDLTSPIAVINYSKTDIKTSIGSSFFELTYHRSLYNDFYFIGGFNFTNYNFRVSSTMDSIKSYKKVDQTLGVSVGMEYRFNNYYSVAAVYRPALASFETDAKYRHLINVELRIDLDFKKKK